MCESFSEIKSLTTCIVGGGNSAHVLIPFLHKAGHKVHLLTRRPHDWRDVVYCEITNSRTGQVSQNHAGSIHRKSSEPRDVIPEADIVILCMPVHQYRPALDRLAPFLNRDKEIFVGTIYGQAGFNWMVRSIEREHNLTNIVTFAIGQIPWICRTLEYGRACANYGGKQVNTVAVSPADKFDKLEQILLNDISLGPMNMGKFVQDSFLSLTMCVDNQIIHPARCYGLWETSNQGKWESIDQVPFFYKDFDEVSADNIRRIDEEYSLIRKALRNRFPDHSFPYMVSYMELEKLNHGSCHQDILASFRDSPQLAAIQTPTVAGPNDQGRLLNTEARFFTDDISYGLLIAKSIADKLDVRTPFLDEIIAWAQSLRKESFLKPDGKINMDYCLKDKYSCGIPESYGLNKLEDILD